MKEQKMTAYRGIDGGACPEYSCPRLDAFCALMPAARKLLEELRKRQCGHGETQSSVI